MSMTSTSSEPLRLPTVARRAAPAALPFHPLAWVGWLVAALGLLLTTRNPLYLTLILLCIAIVRAALLRSTEGGWQPPLSPWRFAALAIPASALFNALSAHFGDTVLVILPRALPLFGGPITLEALAFGALNGVVLTGIFAAFAVLNQALPMRALVRLIPRAFQPVAVVVTVALSFVPATVRHFQQIREAQAVRGHRVRGLRDWLPLFLPLLIGGLERALQLAEAMTARGFASQSEALSFRERATIVGALLLLLAGWLLQLGWGIDAGYALMALGGGIVAHALWRAGRRVPHSNYRPAPWQARDWLMLGMALLALLPVVPLPWAARRTLFYYPYPALTLPAFDPLVAMALLALLAPAFMLRRAPVPATEQEDAR